MINNKINKLIPLFLSFGISSAFAIPMNCPAPEEIQSTDFTSPSIWIAPPIPHSVPDRAGMGLGGRVAKKLLGTEKAIINKRDGWVCVYESEGGVSVTDYQNKIRDVITGNKYLRRYIDRMNKIFENAEPYLKNYPKNIPLGFVGYQLADESSLQKNKP